jgi:hypothetical protein
MNNREYIVHTHLDSSITTVLSFLTQTNGIADYYEENGTLDLLKIKDGLSYGVDAKSFLDYSGGSDVNLSNTDRIYNAYSPSQKLEYKSIYESGGQLTELAFGTTLMIPKSKINLEPYAIQGVNQVAEYESFPAFYAKNLVDLINDEKYRPVSIVPRSSGSEATTQDFPNVTVWIWTKCFPDKLINVSPFVISCNTSSNEASSSFEIDLAPITGEINENGEWQLDSSTFYGENGFTSHSNITREVKLGKTGKTKSMRSKYLFHHVISENDLVFIRFETLEMEKEGRDSTKNKFFIDLDEISSTNKEKKVYDLIGLVDQTIISVQADASNVSINMTGRDLTKLLIDDGVYFYPVEFIGDKVRAQSNDQLISRMVTDKGFVLQTLAGAKQSIPYLLQFVMNYLSNIEIIPDGVFKSYGDRVVQTYKLKDESQDKSVSNSELSPVKGIWKIIKIVVDKNIANRRITDTGFSQEDGSLITYFNKLCQKPLVEMFTDTYEDMFFIVVRKPPFDKKSIESYLEADLSSESSIVDVKFTENDKTRFAEDSAFSTETQGKDVVGREVGVIANTTKSTEAIISIDDYNVIDETIQFEDEDFYNVFQIEPQEIVLGAGAISTVFLPMVTIPELVKVYGARRIKVESVYMTHSETAGSKGKYSISYLYEQALNDLSYLIETNAYLPFTRKGSITINGDRRIKKNTYIRYRPTGEIFYVNSVSHSASISGASIDRTTTLGVSRGMRESYIDKSLNDDNMSYFDIVNTELIKSRLSDRFKNKEVKEGNSVEILNSVDEKVLDFFYKGKQFKD